MPKNLEEEFFRLDGAWASFELMSIRKREDYLKPFRVLRCQINARVDFASLEPAVGLTEASVWVDIFGTEETEVGRGRGAVHALDHAMRKVLEKHYPQLSEVELLEFDVRLLHHGDAEHEEDRAGVPVRVLGIFTDGRESWGTVGVAEDILSTSVECIIDGIEWKLRGEHKH